MGRPRTPDISGRIFGDLHCIELKTTSSKGELLYLCLCKCGNEVLARKSDLVSGKKKSCGCKQGQRSHGLSRENGKASRLHSVWVGIRQRCNNPKSDSYFRYGGRGIKICQEWNDYKNFYNWAMSHGYQKGLTIERIDNDGDYCPENCTWIPQGKQMQNIQKSRFASYSGKTQTIGKWARDLGIDRGTLSKEIRSGLTIADVIAKRGISYVADN